MNMTKLYEEKLAQISIAHVRAFSRFPLRMQDAARIS